MQKQNATGIWNGIQSSERAHFNMPGHLKGTDLTMAPVQYLRWRCEMPWKKFNLNRTITVCIRSKQHKGQNMNQSRIGESKAKGMDCPEWSCIAQVDLLSEEIELQLFWADHARRWNRNNRV
jgi:hypothetical protein